jgi:DNA-binding NarL/FixJ family response regulator
LLDAASIRILVVEDHECWHRLYSTMFQKHRQLQVIGAVFDGLKAVEKAQELQPDLILLDIGLPTLNGIEAAGRIRGVSPTSKILFVSENRSSEIAEEALDTGAGGYVVKSEAASELLPAVKAVLEGERFVSASLAGHHLNLPRVQHAAAIRHCHDVAFFVDDGSAVFRTMASAETTGRRIPAGNAPGFAESPGGFAESPGPPLESKG